MQHTKQLCYGMIYGMGVKSLAENLCVSESEAQGFLECFMNAYPGIYKWLNDVLEEAHHDGYVSTLLGRRRELPDFNKDRLDQEWAALCAYEADPSSTGIAESEANAEQNRPSAALPYDHSRIVSILSLLSTYNRICLSINCYCAKV